MCLSGNVRESVRGGVAGGPAGGFSKAFLRPLSFGDAARGAAPPPARRQNAR